MKLRALLVKEFSLELRRKHFISGILLYLFSTIFIYYISFNLQKSAISADSWSALFWITLLFSAVSTIAKSFMSESKGREIFYYCLLSPESVILSKIIYNFMLCMFLIMVGFFLFTLFLTNPISNGWIFVATLVLTSLAFSGTFTLLSGIAGKANNGPLLMAVLGFPTIIGVLLLAIKLTKHCIDGLDPSGSYDELLTLGAINLLVSAVSYLLFPYIWRS